MGKENLPCSSIYLRAFSRKDGDPSTSSRASKTGLPMTKGFMGTLSLTAEGENKASESPLSKNWKRRKVFLAQV